METLVTLSKGTDEATEEASRAPQKYRYPEFAGWSGERYLKKLLRQILPMALYRTWEIFADHQALGNECYLGVTHLAEIAGRTTRTIEKNLASLSAKHLMVERLERKVFRHATGLVKSKVVIIKDFAGLYALAHEYHEWLNADEYLAAHRELMPFLERSPHLIAKLRRFENYRKVLSNRLPGPVSQVQDEDRWFTEYQTEPSFVAKLEQAQDAKSSQRGVIPAKDPTKHLADDMAKGSPKRITTEHMKYRSEGESSDSVGSSSENAFLKNEQQVEHSEKPQKTLPPLMENPLHERQQERPSLSSVPSVQRELLHSPARKQEHLEAPGEVMRTVQVKPAPPVRPESDNQAAPSHLLARSFLREIAAPFGDGNQKGTATRMLSLLKDTHLKQPAEVLLCLMHAYVIARDTRTIRPEHCHPETGRANRMPLFCTLFQRFVEAHAQGRKWDYSWQRMKTEIAADSRLTEWWKEHQRLVGEPYKTTLHEPDGEQKRSDALFSGKEPFIVDAPASPTCHPRLSQNNGVLTRAPVGISKPPSVVALSAQKPDQYDIYVNALLATYSAPEALQEVN